jgi:hypothetical protein
MFCVGAIDGGAVDRGRVCGCHFGTSATEIARGWAKARLRGGGGC